jgi:glycerol-3-phosphate acyltransferase PlsY
MTVAEALAALVGGYLLGAIPFGLLLTRAAGLGDIRAIGSGNIGATNVLRTGKRGLAVATLVLDFVKGMVAVLLGAHFLGRFGGAVAGLGAVLGHLFPVWLGFRGGKWVATGSGVLLAAAWPAWLAGAAAWLVVALAARISSLAALAACLVSVIGGFVVAPPAVATLLLVVGALIVWRHEPNIARLRAGTEPRMGKS